MKDKLGWFGFYSILFWTGIVVIPVLGIVGPTFIVCGVIVPIAGFIKLLGYLFHFEVPFVMFQVGSVTLHPAFGFVFSMVMGILLYVAGRMIWRLLLRYFSWIAHMKATL